MRKNEASTFIYHRSPDQAPASESICNYKQPTWINNSETKTVWSFFNFFRITFSPLQLQNQVPYFCKVAGGRSDYVATLDFPQDFHHISVEATTAWQTKCFSSDSDSRALAARTPSSGTRFQASCSCLDRVQSVMPSRVHHGGASAEQKAWVRVAVRASNWGFHSPFGRSSRPYWKIRLRDAALALAECILKNRFHQRAAAEATQSGG